MKTAWVGVSHVIQLVSYLIRGKVDVKHQRIVGQVTEEGEVLEGARLVLSYDRPKTPYRQFLVMNQGEELEALAASRLSGETLSVFLMALKRLDYENLMVLNHTEIAERLGLKRPNVSRSIAKLLEVGVILAGPRVAGKPTYRLNPGFGWKGKVYKLRETFTSATRSAAQGPKLVSPAGDPA